MKVMVSSPMVKVIRQALPDCRVSLVKMKPEVYRMNVDYDVFNNGNDFDYKTGMMKAIRIDYPDEYYAMPRYISTRELSMIFRESNHTMTGFIEAVQNNCMV